MWRRDHFESFILSIIIHPTWVTISISVEVGQWEVIPFEYIKVKMFSCILSCYIFVRYNLLMVLGSLTLDLAWLSYEDEEHHPGSNFVYFSHNRGLLLIINIIISSPASFLIISMFRLQHTVWLYDCRFRCLGTHALSFSFPSLCIWVGGWVGGLA